MAEKNKKGIIIIIIAILAIFLFFGGKAISQPGETPVSEAIKDTAIKPFFADANYNPVEIPPANSIAELQSTVTFPGVGEKQGIYFMRYDISVYNPHATASKTITIKDINVRRKDTGEEVQLPLVSNAFFCLLNKPATIGPLQTYTWTTNPANNPFGCSSGSWLNTLRFEQYGYIDILATVESQVTIFGVLRTATVTKNLTVYIVPDGNLAGVEVNIPTGDNSTIQDCTPGTISACPLSDVSTLNGTTQVSLCYGVTQTCGLNYVYPGCSYGGQYSGYKESNGYSGSDFKVTCKDGKDNDCDGVWDKPSLDATCSRGTCDYDCPYGFTKFRTNALLQDGETYSDFESSSIWISVYNPTDNRLKGYKYTGTTNEINSAPCNNAINLVQGSNVMTTTPLRAVAGIIPNNVNAQCEDKGYTYANCPGFTVSLSSDRVTAYIHYDTDGNSVNGCKRMTFGSGGSPCGDELLCTESFPTEPYNLYKEETTVDY